MKRTEIITKKVESVVDITCDSCGESCLSMDWIVDNDERVDHGEYQRQYEYMHMKTDWGYGSDHDCESWEAHVCQKCVDEKMGFITFKKENYI